MGGKLKYWLLTTEFPPFFGGGISTYCRETVRMLSGGGYEVSVFLPDGTAQGIVEHIKDGTRVIRFNPYSYEERDFLGYETLVSYAFAKVLQAYVEAEGVPFQIESQEYNGIAYFTLLYKKLLYPAFRNMSLMITVHAPSFVCLPYNHVAVYRLPYFWIGEMEKFCLKAADLVITPSHYMAREIQKRAPEIQLNYSRVHNPFYLSQMTGEGTNAAETSEFVFYGKASPLKGIFELLLFFRKVWEREPGITLRLLGGTDYYYHPEGRMMEDIIKEKYAVYITAGQLILEGSVNPGKLKEKIAHARAIIIPSRVDNLPYAVIECMAMGKIVLGSDSGGHKELIEDGENGFLFSLEDRDSFEQKLFHILYLDKPSMDRISKNAIDSIRKQCDPEAIFSMKEALIGRLKASVALPAHFPFLRQVVEPLQPGDKEEIPAGTMGLLSVVIPYYNMSAYVDEAVRSVLNSGYQPIEIILVNDGSNEPGSMEKLQALAKNPAIRVFHKENEGLSVARNIGALQAGGEFLAFLDPDDRVDPAYYGKALEVLQYYNNVHFSGSWVKYFESGKGIWPCFTPEPPFVLYHNMINTSSLVYKRNSFLKYGSNDKEMIFGMEDYDSLLGMLENGCSGVALPEPLFHYRIRKNSMARQFTRNKILYLYQRLSQKHNKFYSIFAAEISNLLNSNGQGFLHDNPTLDLHISSNNKVIRKILKARGIQYIKQNKKLRKAIVKINQFFKTIKLC